MRRYTVIAVALSLAFAGTQRSASAQTFDFSIDSSQSGFQGNASLNLAASGSLIGNYNASTNPGGTRTIPSGTQPTAGVNLPVEIAPALDLGGPIQTSASGSFTLSFNLSNSSVTISHYQVDLLSGESVNLPASLTLNNQAFVTRAPTFSYPADTDPISLGDLAIDTLKIAQSGTTLHGTLKQTAANSYRFVVTFKAVYTVDLKINGKDEPFSFSAPAALTGQVTFSGSAAQIVWSAGQKIERTIKPNRSLPTFPVSLPALPGHPANVLVSLNLDQVAIDLGGTFSLVANGTE